MGCGPSILEQQKTSTLDITAPLTAQSDALAGAFVIVRQNPMKLDRDIRVTLKLRATMVTLTGYKNKYSNEPEKEEQAHILWEAGGVIAKRGTTLQAGENRLSFDFGLDGKLGQFDAYVKPQELVQKFGPCTYIQYDYILRGGSLQVQEFVQYPKVMPQGDNGMRVIDKNHEGLSTGLVGSILGGVVGGL